MVRLLMLVTLLGLLEPQKLDRVRHVDGDDILSDVQSHLQSDHGYNVVASDYGAAFVDQDSLNISTAHECTHGINAELRVQHSKKEKYNGFYLLDDNYVIIKEPDINTLSILNKVPKRLRFNIYQSTYDNTKKFWQDRPLYLFDEFIAHTTGMLYRKQKGIKIRTECPKYTLEMGIYCLFLLQEMRNSPDYDKLKDLTIWNFNRIIGAYQGEQGFKEQMSVLLNDKDCSEIKWFIKNELGGECYNLLLEVVSGERKKD